MPEFDRVYSKSQIDSTTEGSSGASRVGLSAIAGITARNVQAFAAEIASRAGGLATRLSHGAARLSAEPVDPADPIVAGDNDPRLTDARVPLAHAHNDIYYTETESDTLLAGKSNTGHTHPAVDIPYNNTGSGLVATNTNAAIDEVAGAAGVGGATELAAGITEQATEAEVQAGTAGNLFATVARLKAELDRRQGGRYFLTVYQSADISLAQYVDTKFGNTVGEDVSAMYSTVNLEATIPASGLWQVETATRIDNGGQATYCSVKTYRNGVLFRELGASDGRWGVPAGTATVRLTAGDVVSMRGESDVASGGMLKGQTDGTRSWWTLTFIKP